MRKLLAKQNYSRQVTLPPVPRSIINALNTSIVKSSIIKQNCQFSKKMVSTDTYLLVYAMNQTIHAVDSTTHELVASWKEEHDIVLVKVFAAHQCYVVFVQTGNNALRMYNVSNVHTKQPIVELLQTIPCSFAIAQIVFDTHLTLVTSASETFFVCNNGLQKCPFHIAFAASVTFVKNEGKEAIFLLQYMETGDAIGRYKVTVNSATSKISEKVMYKLPSASEFGNQIILCIIEPSGTRMLCLYRDESWDDINLLNLQSCAQDALQIERLSTERVFLDNCVEHVALCHGFAAFSWSSVDGEFYIQTDEQKIVTEDQHWLLACANRTVVYMNSGSLNMHTFCK